ncbi:MAG: hypothetical protein ACRD3F_06620 [Acidobacteriaceae bacterium]
MVTTLGVIGWGALALAHAQSAAPLQEANTKIQVHVIDGRTGTPISNERILIFATNDSKNPKVRLINRSTDTRGIAAIRTDFRFLQVFVDWHVLCFKDPNQLEYATSEVVRKGVISPDTCGKVKVNLQPGELYVFARPRHWWEPTSGFNPFDPKNRNRDVLLIALAP